MRSLDLSVEVNEHNCSTFFVSRCENCGPVKLCRSNSYFGNNKSFLGFEKSLAESFYKLNISKKIGLTDFELTQVKANIVTLLGPSVFRLEKITLSFKVETCSLPIECSESLANLLLGESVSQDRKGKCFEPKFTHSLDYDYDQFIYDKNENIIQELLPKVLSKKEEEEESVISITH